MISKTNVGATDRVRSREALLLRRILNKHTILYQLSAALFRLIPSNAVQSICIKHRYAGQSRWTQAKDPPPWGLQRPGYSVNRLQKFLSKIYGSRSIRQITQITPPKTSTKPTITDHTTSVIDVQLWFRTVLNVIIQMSRLYRYKRPQKDNKDNFHRPHNLHICPHCRINLRITHSNQLFTLICNYFMFFLSTISTPKLTVMNPRPQCTVHIHPSRSTKWQDISCTFFCYTSFKQLLIHLL